MKMILFINKTNNCYLISVIQALLGIPILVNYLKNCNEKSEIVDMFKYMINQLHDPKKNIVESNSVMKILGNYDPFFNGRNQEDAHECMIRIFDIITKECKNKGIRNKFNIHFRTIVKCNKCDYLSNNDFVNWCIILNFKDTKNKFTLSELFKDYVQIEHLDAKCTECKRGTISKCTKITRVPQVLVIVFSKFNQLSTGVEVSKKIKINLNTHTNTNSVDYFYNLASKINHTGNLNSGHYTTDRPINIKNTSAWYNLNDDSIYEIDKETRYDSRCYIAIYTLN